jgi:hypothetical protein
VKTEEKTGIPSNSSSTICNEIQPGGENSGCPTSVSKYATLLCLQTNKVQEKQNKLEAVNAINKNSMKREKKMESPLK